MLVLMLVWLMYDTLQQCFKKTDEAFEDLQDSIQDNGGGLSEDRMEW